MGETSPKDEDESEAEETDVDSKLAGKGVDPDISKSLTVAVKFITHRGTQTIIQCDPGLTKDDFIDIIMRTKV